MMKGEPTEVQKAFAKVLENREWFDAHVFELQEEYRGMVVAIYNEEVIASDTSIEKAKKALKGKFPLEAVLFIHVPREDITIMPYAEPGEEG